MSIKQSIQKLLTVRNDSLAVDRFCLEEFRKHFKKSPNQIGSWRGYKDFELINEKEIKINYRHGAGDMEFDDYFIAKIPQ